MQPSLQQLLLQLQQLLHAISSFLAHVETLLLQLLAMEEAATPALDTLFSVLVCCCCCCCCCCLELLHFRGWVDEAR